MSYYFIEQRAIKQILSIVLMQTCACLKEHMRVDCFALFTWFARAVLLAGIVKTATGKACNE